MKLLGKHFSNHLIGFLSILVTITSLVHVEASKAPIPSNVIHHPLKGPFPTENPTVGVPELNREVTTVGEFVKCSLITYFGATSNFGTERYCVTASKEVITLNGDVQAVLGRFNYSFQGRHTELHFPQNAIRENAMVYVDELYAQGQITVEFSNPIIPPRPIPTKGTNKVLVVLVTDEYGNKPSQTEDQMHYDVFGDKSNNLVSMSICVYNITVLHKKDLFF